MEIAVWVASWQFECCGELFRVGSRVEWTLRRRNLDTRWLTDALGASAEVKVDAYEDHHGGGDEGIDATHGTVIRIRAVHCRRDGTAVPGSAVVTELDEAERWIPDHGERGFAGFLVDLKEDRTA